MAKTQAPMPAETAEHGRRGGTTGYLLLLPGLLWLVLFFVIPFYSLVAASLYDPAGSDFRGYQMTYHWQNYTDALKEYGKPEGWNHPGWLVLAAVIGVAVAVGLLLRGRRTGAPERTVGSYVGWGLVGAVAGLAVLFPIFKAVFIGGAPMQLSPLLRSLLYGALATAFCLLLGYVLAYAIAFKSGRWKTLLLVLVIAPFFTSFLVRTLSWKLLLGDGSVITHVFQSLHLIGSDGQLLYTPFAVIAGLTYNFLPFMVLPLFASLDKIDYRLIEASRDLYANPLVGFFKVTWPLSLPGVISGTLLTFIPAVGDYINAELLGSTKTRMIGSVIQSLFTDANDYPAASALSVMLMVLIVGMVLVYVRRAGTEELL